MKPAQKLKGARLEAGQTQERDDASLLAHREESKDAVKSRRAFLRFVLVTVYLVVWGVSVLAFWMGGRTDATNLIKKPVCSVITSVSMDHMQFLGDTLTKIATEKAGIIKPYTTVISAPQVREVSKVLREICEVQHASYIEVNPSDWEVLQMNLDGTEVVDCGTNPDETNMDADMDQRQQPYHIPLLGEHQIANAQTAITVLRTLYIEETAIHKGIAQTVWLGRMTKVAEHPYIYVDGAHNVAAWEYLRTSVEKYFTNIPITYIIGVLADKEHKKVLEAMLPYAGATFTVTPDNPRAMKAEELASEAEAIVARLWKERAGKPEKVQGTENSPQGAGGMEPLPKVSACSSMKEAVQLALEHTKKDGVILAFGSLSYLKEIRQIMQSD